MPKRKGYEFLEHTADIYIAAYGESLEEAFQNAALAMFEVMTDTRTVKTKIEERVEVDASDKQALLYNWLEQLLVKFETEGKLYSRFKVERVEKKHEGLSLKATVYGEPFERSRHPSRVEVKAVTYHRMEIEEKKGSVTLKFILDI